MGTMGDLCRRERETARENMCGFPDPMGYFPALLMAVLVKTRKCVSRLLYNHSKLYSRFNAYTMALSKNVGIGTPASRNSNTKQNK